MNISCPNCSSHIVRKNGSTHTGKQKYQCVSCNKQFVENPQNKMISEGTKERIRRSLLERVSLEGICRIFDISYAMATKIYGKDLSVFTREFTCKYYRRK